MFRRFRGQRKEQEPRESRTLAINTNDTFETIKHQVERKVGIPANQQRMVLRVGGQYCLLDESTDSDGGCTRETVEGKGDGGEPDGPSPPCHGAEPITLKKMSRRNILRTGGVLVGILGGVATGAVVGAAIGLGLGVCGGPLAFITIPQGILVGMVVGGALGAVSGGVVSFTVDQHLSRKRLQRMLHETDCTIAKQLAQIKQLEDINNRALRILEQHEEQQQPQQQQPQQQEAAQNV
eukprot:TRINITY_DN2917_c1_g1_i1.p1 TRINITY_DN2917_c1_g1~~TRINITY_DN2917_c1_g1_i1.p1  ORF type:complete len:237 (-),score=40.25 TRINITY_DN2917_c1_g1_i1:74-784(-)